MKKKSLTGRIKARYENIHDEDGQYVHFLFKTTSGEYSVLIHESEDQYRFANTFTNCEYVPIDEPYQIEDLGETPTMGVDGRIFHASPLHNLNHLESLAW